MLTLGQRRILVFYRPALHWHIGNKELERVRIKDFAFLLSYRRGLSDIPSFVPPSPIDVKTLRGCHIILIQLP